jgi:cell division protein FtsB
MTELAQDVAALEQRRDALRAEVAQLEEREHVLRVNVDILDDNFKHGMKQRARLLEALESLNHVAELVATIQAAYPGIGTGEPPS